MTRPRVTPAQVFRLALYYGVAGFGGGYSVLAQLRRELVERRQWVSAEEFLVLAEVSKSLPGTPATSLLALLGQRVAGVRGGLAAAVAFLAPSAALMVACGAAYAEMRRATALTTFFDGMNAAMVGVVAAVTVDLARAALRNKWDVALAVAAAAALAARVLSEPLLAALAAVGGALVYARRARRADGAPPPPSERLHARGALVAFLLGAGASQLAALARVFVPIGVMTFGGGLAMIPAIEHTVVVDHGWLDPKEFADAIALGQITPGPVAICATFIGYRVAGLAGAVVATVAMFTPATILALVVGHSVERFRRSPILEGALRALAPAVIGMLAAATWSLGRASVHGVLAPIVVGATFLVLLRARVSPMWPLVLGGVLHVVVVTLFPHAVR